ncbi:hypothetical protein G7Y79_00020g048600 [Physcia stellaris]|nr:hypothetical protein G7Y79_00020g048600 [Physcia stellaris]
MRFSILIASVFAAAAAAQNCGPSYGNQKCAAGKCCSQYGWCDTGAAYCDPATCLKTYSGTGSSCATPSDPYASTVPNIDVCGHAQGGVSCPGAGKDKYFYRCCSSQGHCGPKNNIQDQALYCGAGCQAGFGDCSTNRKKPADPTTPPKTAKAGDTCGPIVNAKCATGLCCSGSNFCGTGVDFCGAANWCQSKWGKCS